mmetsp:Transcript_47721/g.102274  ORF Transcript_47721/g.102274 Transcript_47721/m.102274 type:complete len:228 (+) Transcript_47721:2225-2908(+)
MDAQAPHLLSSSEHSSHAGAVAPLFPESEQRWACCNSGFEARADTVPKRSRALFAATWLWLLGKISGVALVTDDPGRIAMALTKDTIAKTVSSLACHWLTFKHQVCHNREVMSRKRAVRRPFSCGHTPSNRLSSSSCEKRLFSRTTNDNGYMTTVKPKAKSKQTPKKSPISLKAVSVLARQASKLLTAHITMRAQREMLLLHIHSIRIRMRRRWHAHRKSESGSPAF